MTNVEQAKSLRNAGACVVLANNQALYSADDAFKATGRLGSVVASMPMTRNKAGIGFPDWQKERQKQQGTA